MWKIDRPIIIMAVLLAGLGVACHLTSSIPTPPTPSQVTPSTLQGNTPMPESCPATIYFNESSSGNTYNIHKGDVIGITLKTNPSTGYDWQVEKADPAMLLRGENVYSGFNKDLVGSSGHITLCFTALKTGKSEIELAYRRSWEKPSQSNPAWKITLQISE